MNTQQPYIHGSSTSEQVRLSLLNSFFNENCLRELGPKAGDRVLDLGSGLGQLTRAIARSTGPTGRVLAIERDAAQLDEAIRLAHEDGEEDLVEFRQGDALDPPLAQCEIGSFDIAHCRFVLEHVRNPLSVVRHMVNAVRPGGRVVLLDDDHPQLNLSPACPPFMNAWRAYIRSYDRLGVDPRIGSRLVSLLVEAGAQPSRATMIYMGGCAGMAYWQAVIDNAAGVFEGARETLIGESLMTDAELDEAIKAFRDWGTKPDAVFWYAVPWAEGRRPV